MPNLYTAVDVEGPVRDWLKLQGTPAADRIYLRNPTRCPVDGSGNALAYVTVARVGGAPEGGHARIDAPLMTFSCYARTGALASALAHALATIFESLPSGTSMPPMVFLGGSVELGPVQLADPDQPAAGWPSRARYVVDVAMRVRPA